MAPNIQVFLEVALLLCAVTISMGGTSDWQKAFSELENKVNVQQDEIKSLHQIIEQLERRFEPIEANSEFNEVRILSKILHAC